MESVEFINLVRGFMRFDDVAESNFRLAAMLSTIQDDVLCMHGTHALVSAKSGSRKSAA
jgi:hypothetical protein